MAWTDDRSPANPTHLWIQNCSAGKFFCMTASSNVWVSHRASRYVTADMACMWHGEAIVVPQIQPTSESPRRFEKKIFPFEQVRMSGCRVEPQDTSQLTSHAHGMDRQSKSCKSGPPLNLQPVSKLNDRRHRIEQMSVAADNVLEHYTRRAVSQTRNLICK